MGSEWQLQDPVQMKKNNFNTITIIYFFFAELVGGQTYFDSSKSSEFWPDFSSALKLFWIGKKIWTMKYPIYQEFDRLPWAPL